jgi:hypothetical protein
MEGWETKSRKLVQKWSQQIGESDGTNTTDEARGPDELEARVVPEMQSQQQPGDPDAEAEEIEAEAKREVALRRVRIRAKRRKKMRGREERKREEEKRNREEQQWPQKQQIQEEVSI